MGQAETDDLEWVNAEEDFGGVKGGEGGECDGRIDNR